MLWQAADCACLNRSFRCSAAPAGAWPEVLAADARWTLLAIGSGIYYSCGWPQALGDDEQVLREGYSALFKRHNLKLDAFDKTALVLFPEITVAPDLPEITEECWQILNVDPDAMMCASSRMVVVRRGDRQPSVMACTLLAYDQQFNLGASLVEAQERVQLNHPHCASFCVLGGGTCSVG